MAIATDLSVGSGTPAGPPNTWQISKRVDCSATTLTAATHTLFSLPAGSVVTQCATRVITGEGATATATIGQDGGDVDGFQAGVDLETAGSTGTPGAELGDPTSFSVADTVDIVVANECDTAVFEVTIQGYTIATA